jgi:acyl-coenzyme A thioesterase PaaI-like protein
MKRINFILTKARTSSFYLWVLNVLLWRLIPFNKSHKVTIEKLEEDKVTIKLPYRKTNQNHLKGMHACALATLCEYASGIGLMTQLNAEHYRIILKEIKLDFQAQAKSDVFASFELNKPQLQTDIIEPLALSGVIVKTFPIRAYDHNHKTICMAEITWQLKSWEKVKHKNS